MSFEETYKTSYSHGLESIYALETVDLRSVRLLNVCQDHVSPPVKVPSCLHADSPQFTFDLGPNFRDWMEPFLLDEPIQVLGLTRHAERCLLEQHKLKLGDLAAGNLRLIFANRKGIGQGHLDEITAKFNSYTAGKEMERSHLIDPGSWLRSRCPFEQRKQCYLLLESFGLEDMLPLGPAENTEVRRLTSEQKEQWRAEGLALMRSEPILSDISKTMHTMVTVFVRPWIAGRNGLATQEEITERLEKRFSDRGKVQLFMKFLGKVLNVAGYPLNPFLEQADREVYTAHRWQAEMFTRLMACARTYFRHKGQVFPLSHLISLIEREEARRWQGYPEAFVEKALRLSSSFRVRKGESGCLEIRSLDFV